MVVACCLLVRREGGRKVLELGQQPQLPYLTSPHLTWTTAHLGVPGFHSRRKNKFRTEILNGFVLFLPSLFPCCSGLSWTWLGLFLWRKWYWFLPLVNFELITECIHSRIQYIYCKCYVVIKRINLDNRKITKKEMAPIVTRTRDLFDIRCNPNEESYH